MSLHPAEDVCICKRGGRKECEQTIHQGHQQPVPREYTEVENSSHPDGGFWTTQEEVQGIYNEVYQQKRLPGPPTVWARTDGGPWFGNLHFLGWANVAEVGTTRPGEDWGEPLWVFAAQPPDQIPTPEPGKEWGPTWPRPSISQGGTSMNIRGTHLLEQDIERLSWAASRAKHAKFQCPYSCSCSWGRVPREACPVSKPP